ncbi:MAG: hypothetical protein ACJZ8O_02700 [Pirellulaceae bacterium]
MNARIFVPLATLILLTGIFVIPELLIGDDAEEQRVEQRQDENARLDEINAKRKEIIRKVYQLKRELNELEETGNEDAARRVANEIEEYTHVLEELAEDRDHADHADHDHDGEHEEHEEEHHAEVNELDEIRHEIGRLERLYNELREAGKEDGAHEVAQKIEELVHILREHEEHEEHQHEEREHREEDHREVSGAERAERELHGLRQRYEDLIEAGKEDAARGIGQRIRRVEIYLQQQEREHNERREHNDGNDIERQIIELKHKHDDLIADGQEEEARKVANHIEELVHHYRESQEEQRHAEHDHDRDDRAHLEAFERRMHEMGSKLEELHEVRENILRDGNEDELREIEAHIEDLANHMRQMKEEFHHAHEHENERDGEREGHPSREQIEHVVQAVEHLHAAGLHDYAEALKRNVLARIDDHDGRHDEHREHDDDHGHDDHGNDDHHDEHHGHDHDNHQEHQEHVEAMHDAIHDAHRRIDELGEHLEKVTRHLDEVTEFVKKLADQLK